MNYAPLMISPDESVLPADGNQCRVVCPIRRTKPTAALLHHSEKAALPSQTKAINDFRAAEAAKAAKYATENQQTTSTTPPEPTIPAPVLSVPSTLPDNSKRPWVEETQSLSDVILSSDDERENARTNPKCECILSSLRESNLRISISKKTTQIGCKNKLRRRSGRRWYPY
jgi:hypothetical protein